MSFLRWWLAVAWLRPRAGWNSQAHTASVARRDHVQDPHARGIAERLEERRSRFGLLVGESGRGEGRAAGQVERCHIDAYRNDVRRYVKASAVQALERLADPVERRGGDERTQEERERSVDRAALALAVDRVDDAGADGRL